MNRVKICTISIISLLVISFLSGLYVFHYLLPVPAIKQVQTSQGWHDVETWTFFASTFPAVAFVFAIRPVDVYAYLCDEDDDFEKGVVQYFQWLLNKAKKKALVKLKEEYARKT